MPVWKMFTQLFARNYNVEDLHEVCPKGALRRSERKKLSWQQGDGRADQFRCCSLDALMTIDESWIYCNDPETKRQSSKRRHAGSARPKKARQSRSTNKFLMIPFFDSTGMIYMQWVPTGRTVKKEYYVEVLREFRKRFLWKRPELFKSGQWHFHHDSAPVHNSSLSQTIWSRYSPDLALCDFWLFPKLKGKLRNCHYETIERDERGCDEGHWCAYTRGLPGGLSEVVRTAQQIHCSWKRLFRRGL